MQVPYLGCKRPSREVTTMFSFFTFLALASATQAKEPPTVITVSETVIVYVVPRCSVRPLVQGSGTVRVCE